MIDDVIVYLSLELSHEELNKHFSKFDLKRLELYSRNLADYHLITDLLPTSRLIVADMVLLISLTRTHTHIHTVSRLFFKGQVSIKLSAAQSAILLGMGLQHKSVEVLQVGLHVQLGSGIINVCCTKVH